MSEEGFARIQAMPLFDGETAGACSFDDIDASQKNDKNKVLPIKSPMRESPTATDKSLAAEALRQLMSTSVRHSPLQVSRRSIFQNPVNDNQVLQCFEQSPAIMQRSPSYVVSPSASVPQPPFYTNTDPTYAKAVLQYDHKEDLPLSSFIGNVMNISSTRPFLNLALPFKSLTSRLTAHVNVSEISKALPFQFLAGRMTAHIAASEASTMKVLMQVMGALRSEVNTNVVIVDK
eukprot:CAMPEP_0196826484 /NCGR_PEP_ID=MMETSP1362-20130617/93651_1 /TAXON_ID=163516 /ORGANISM="Leptocylindrus danicus, Strain CCMP1856" /LENGTH=232 /DNA_ID=CAMNT_0042207057 /DNA_START=166 /DNA_END=865 /DNA_ORIENTATION=-